MAIVGVNITKISAERKEGKGGKINIGNNISIKDVETKELSLGKTKQKGLKFNFLFDCNYEPDLGKINFEGNVVFMDNEDKVKAVKEEWEKNKKVTREMMEPILNAALNKCNIEAIKISQDLGLPSPVPMPRLQKKEEPKKAAK